MFRPYTNNKDIAANLGVSGCLVNELTPTIVNLLSCREWLILSPFCLFFLEIALASAKNLKSTFYSDSSAHTQSTSSSTALVAKLQSWTSDYVWQSFIGIGQIFFNIEFWIIAYLYIVIFVWLLKSFGFHLICCYIKFKLIQHQPLWNQRRICYWKIARVGVLAIFVPDKFPTELDPEDCANELIAVSVSYENDGLSMSSCAEVDCLFLCLLNATLAKKVTGN